MTGGSRNREEHFCTVAMPQFDLKPTLGFNAADFV